MFPSEEEAALMKTCRKRKAAFVRLEPSRDSRPEVVFKFFIHSMFNCEDFGICVFLHVKPRPLRW